jgi:hypothetical protein
MLIHLSCGGIIMNGVFEYELGQIFRNAMIDYFGDKARKAAPRLKNGQPEFRA